MSAAAAGAAGPGRGAPRAPHESPWASLFRAQRGCFPGVAAADRAGFVRLNNAAGSEMPEAAIEAMARYLRTGFGNEGAIFARLAANRDLAARAREATAELVGAEPHEIGFGANTTTNLYALSRALGRTMRPGERVLLSEACHEANVAPWLALRERGVVPEFIPMRDDTHLDYDWLERNLDARTRLVTVGLSSNGTGTVHDVGRVVRAAKRVGALVSLDAAHYVPHRPVDVKALGADLLFFSVYKCFGPHLGAFYVDGELAARLDPYAPEMPGQDRRAAARFETGTKSFESYQGWLGALDYLERLGHAASARLGRPLPAGRRAALRAAMEAVAAWEAELTAHGDALFGELPGLRLYRQAPDDPAPRLGVFCFNVEGRAPAEVAERLEAAGVEAVLGSNGAVRTMRRLAAAQGGVGIRLSIAHYNAFDDLGRAAECLRSLRGRGRLVSA